MSSLLQRKSLYAGFLFMAMLARTHADVSGLGITDDASVGFAWARNSEPNIAGYRLYVGTIPGVYAGYVDVGNVTSFQVRDLVRGSIYYFALTAYNTAGQESNFAPELTRQIPLVLTNAPSIIGENERGIIDTNMSDVLDTGSITNVLDEVLAAKTPPEISRIADVRIVKNRASDPITFTVSDGEVSASDLQIVVASSDPYLIPQEGLVIQGTDVERTLIVNPANGRSGVALVTIAITDGINSTSMSFQVTVGDGLATTVLGIVQ